MKRNQLLRVSFVGPITMLLFTLVAAGRATAQLCPAGGATLYIRGPHDTKGILGQEGPTYPSNWSLKAITEKADVFYGGFKCFPAPSATGGGRTKCHVTNVVDVQYVESALTTARHQQTTPHPYVYPFMPDFDIYQLCYNEAVQPYPFIDVVKL